ncbi:hypothetical protein [Owenweeksia hongkongensis]|uniref:hypothetical protein n=1 Tax=Owenweeksia hongkongensis TaxID=253245 RepID=UPI003A932C42
MKKIIAAVILFLFVLGACKEEEDPKYAKFNYYIKMQPSSLFDSLHFNVTKVSYDNMLDQNGWHLPLNISAVFDLQNESQLFLGTIHKAGLEDYPKSQFLNSLNFRHIIRTKNHWIVENGEYRELDHTSTFSRDGDEFVTGMDVYEGDVVDVIFNLDVDKSVRLDSAGADWIKWVGEVEMVKK